MVDIFKDSSLNVDLSHRVKNNKFLFKGKYKSISDYFKRANIENWWNPEEGKGDTGLNKFAKIQKIKQRKIQDFLKKTKSQKILEIGPGTGRFTRFLVKKFDDIFAIELNDTFYKKLSEEFSGCKNIKIFQDDITTIVFKPKTFDCILMIDVAVHIPDLVSLIEKIQKWLKNDGVFIVDITVLEWYKHHHKVGTIHRGIDENEFEKLLRTYGFIIQKKFEQYDEKKVKYYSTYFTKLQKEKAITIDRWL